jgi:ATP-dependent DNA helicase RecG
MVVEHAERFGLSQLHQLRGRVGRGGADSYCVLIASGAPDSRERLRVLAETQDGFEIARADLRLRGMGDFFGSRQHGLPEFRFLDPHQDEQILLAAREHALAVHESDPDLVRREHQALRGALESRLAPRERLYEVG